MDAGARRTAPRRARFDGFVKHRKSKSIISYRILVAKRSESESACLPIRPRLTYRPAINAQKLRAKTRTQNLFCEKCLKTKVKKCRNCTLTESQYCNILSPEQAVARKTHLRNKSNYKQMEETTDGQIYC